MDKDFQKKLWEFYRGVYDAEAERKEKLHGRAALNIAALTVIANICVFYLDNAPSISSSCNNQIFTIIFYLSLLFAICSGVISLAYFFSSLGFPFGYLYGYIPTASEIHKFIERSEAFNKTVPAAEGVDVESAFIDNLIKQYVDCASKNAINNHKKNHFNHRALIWSVSAVIFLLICAPIHFGLKLTGEKRPQLIEISKPIELKK